jgi:hypothetical protein
MGRLGAGSWEAVVGVAMSDSDVGAEDKRERVACMLTKQPHQALNTMTSRADDLPHADGLPLLRLGEFLQSFPSALHL